VSVFRRRAVEGVPGDRPPFDGYRGLVAPERGEQEIRLDRTGDGQRGPVELRREVAGVDRPRPPIDRELRVDDVVASEPDAVGDRSLVDVDRGDRHSAVGEFPGEPRPPADTDLHEPVVPLEAVGERLDRICVVHGGMFILGAAIAVAMLVDIVPVGSVSPEAKRAASAALRSVYDCEVSINDVQSVPGGAYDSGRNQYCAESFIQLAERVGRGEKNIAITPHDLFYRRRNYVFGLAYLDGSGSVVSTYRLGTSSDGGFSNKSAADIFEDRVRKEIVHEVGHTYGLEHCDNQRCVMNFSPTVREVDIKEENLCGSCRELIE